MSQNLFSTRCSGGKALAAALMATVLSVLMATPLSGAERVQQLIDLKRQDAPALAKGVVAISTGPDPTQIQIGVTIVGSSPNTRFQLQFEGFKGGNFFHYQVCTFTTNAGGFGSCRFNNAAGGAAEIRGNTVPLGSGGTITSGLYDAAFVVICPFSTPPEDAPDLFVTVWGFPGFPDSIRVP
jgi:hypothetical protein